jgi:phage terminase small subunit
LTGRPLHRRAEVVGAQVRVLLAHGQGTPSHLKPATQKWWVSVNQEFALEEHHQRLLTLASEAWDRAEGAREAITRHGLTYVDRFGSPRARPEISVERDSRMAFCRVLRELRLDVQAPDADPRLPDFPNGGRSRRHAT